MPLDELRRLITRHARGGEATAIEGVLVSSVSSPGPPTVSSTGTVLAVIAQGAKRLTLGDRVHDYGAGQYLIASVDLPITGYFSEASRDKPALGFGLLLRPETIASVLLEAPPSVPLGLGRRQPTPPGLAVSTASDALLDAIVRMLRLLDHPADIPVLAPLIEREILWRVITGEQGETVRQLGLPDSGLTHVSRAIRWIRDHYADPFRVDDLAQLSGMSVSAFHRNFQAVTAASPIQFQKSIRLQEARRLLVSGPDDVAGAAYAVGYDSPSQFSREYRRQFGVPPGADAARLRSAAR